MGAFEGCTALESIYLPESMSHQSYVTAPKNICHYAFKDCTGLKTVYIAATDPALEGETFTGCTSLQYLVSNATAPEDLNSNTFQGIPSTATLIVPNGTRSVYQAATGWNQFTNIIERSSSTKDFAIVTAGLGGTLVYGSKEVQAGTSVWDVTKGQSVTVTITPDEGHRLLRLLKDGQDVTAQVSGGKYTVQNVQQDFRLEAVFEEGNAPGPQPEAEPYAVYNNGTLTFYCDNQRSSREGTTYNLNEGWGTPQWFNHSSDITKAVIDASFADARPTSTYMWFHDCKMEEIEGLEYLNTSEVTNMGFMFSWSKLKKVDVSHFDTSSAEYMGYMFAGDSELNELDLSGFNTGKAGVLEGMFQYCGLSKLALGNTFTSTEETLCSDNVFHESAIKVIVYTGDIPASIHSTFFTGVGTASNPAMLYVPAEYRDHYAAKFDGNKFYGGYFTLGGEPAEPILAVEAKVLNAVDGVVYSDHLFISSRWKNISDKTFTGMIYDIGYVKKDGEWKTAWGSFWGNPTIKSGESSDEMEEKQTLSDGTYKIEWGCYRDDTEESTIIATEIVELKSHEQWRSIGIGQYGMMTYSDTDDLDFSSVEGLKAYTAGGFNTTTGEAVMMRVSDVPAETGLLLVGEPWHCYLVSRKTSSTIYVNLLKAVVEKSAEIESAEGEYINYYLNADRFLRIPTPSRHISSHSAYLQIPASAAGSRETITLRFDDTDGISGVEAENETFDVYSLSGTLVKRGATSLKQLPSGIYIVNGCKVVVK